MLYTTLQICFTFFFFTPHFYSPIFDTVSTAGGTDRIQPRFPNIDHEQVLFARETESGYRGIIAIHSTALGPAIGGDGFGVLLGYGQYQLR